MTNFGVELFLKTFLSFARKPAARTAKFGSLGLAAKSGGGSIDDNAPADAVESTSMTDGQVEPDSEEFTGFVFKLQANLDPRHRDRMAFIRVCSGTFRKGMKVSHSRMKKTINLSSAQSLFAQVSLTSTVYTDL